MSKRREFSKVVKTEMLRRAMQNGVVCCEICGVATKHFDFDHINPDALQIDKSRPLTATEGQVLCSGGRDTCHGRKTAESDLPTIAKAKRNEAKHIGIKGRPTPLTGPTRDQIDARKDQRSKDKGRDGRLPRLEPRSLFREAR